MALQSDTRPTVFLSPVTLSVNPCYSKTHTHHYIRSASSHVAFTASPTWSDIQDVHCTWTPTKRTITALCSLPNRPVFLAHLTLPWPQTHFKINGPWNDLQIHPLLPLRARSTQGRRSEMWDNLSGNLPWAPPALQPSSSFTSLEWLSKGNTLANSSLSREALSQSGDGGMRFFSYDVHISDFRVVPL